MLVPKEAVNKVLMSGQRMYPRCFNSVFFYWKMVLAMASYCSVQNSSSMRLLSLQSPMMCLPSNPFRESAFWPSLAWKSPRIIILSSTVVHLSRTSVAYRLFFRGRRMDTMRSEWQVGRFSSLEVMKMLTMKPSPGRKPSVEAFPDQKMMNPAPCSWRLPSPQKRTSLKAAMSAFNPDSSYTIRAERRSGRLLWAASSMVLTFQRNPSVFLLTLRLVSIFLVLMILDCLRRCPLTVSRQLGDERRASVWPTFLGPFPREARSAVPKDGCLVVQGAVGWCFCLKSTSDDEYPESVECRLGTAASTDIFHLSFQPLPIATEFRSVGGVAVLDLSFELS